MADVVTTSTPMKRGLKEPLGLPLLSLLSSNNLYPDEKGTERK